MSNSTCLRADLENSNIGSVNNFRKETRRGINRSCLFTTQSNTKTSPFPRLRVHSKHEGTNMKCKPSCAPGGTFSKTRLASCSGGKLAGCTGECWRPAPARYWPDTRQDPLTRDTQRDTQRDPLASYSGILSGVITAGSTGEPLHWRPALAGYSAGSTGEPL